MSHGLGIAEVHAALDGLLTELVSIGEARGSTDMVRHAAGLADKLEQQQFVVAVVGEFKRGKSSFINALLGAEVLPVGAIPVTSTVTVATYGRVPRVEIGFADGTSEIADIDGLSRYVTERENPGNRRKVARVVVEHPAAPLAEGVQLVDTPGVGSIHQHNTDTTQRFLSEVDAAIFVTSADQPVSHTERLFLEEVSDHVAGMFFVLNKVDILQPGDVGEVVDFTTEALGAAIGRRAVVYPVSSLDALRAKEQGDTDGVERSGISLFERDFGAFLAEEKAAVLARSTARSAARLVAEETNTVKVERETMRLPVNEATSLISRLEEVSARTTTFRRDLEALLEMETRTLIRTVEEDLAALRVSETDRLLAEAGRLLDDHPNPRSAADELDAAVKESLRNSIETWRHAENLTLTGLLSGVTARFFDETATQVERTISLCSQLFDVTLTPPPRDDTFDVDSAFTFAFFDPPDEIQMAVEAIRRRTPSSIARRMLHRRLDEQIPILVDKHCGRLRWDYAQRLDKVRARLSGELADRLDGTLNSLRRGVERAESRRAASESDLATVTAALDATLGRLETIAAGLRSVAG